MHPYIQISKRQAELIYTLKCLGSDAQRIKRCCKILATNTHLTPADMDALFQIMENCFKRMEITQVERN